MKKHLVTSYLVIFLSLILSQTTEAQSPVDNLTNENLDFVERQGDKLQFMMDRMRYRRETGWYHGNRPYFGNGGFSFRDNFGYGGQRHYRGYDGYGDNYDYFGSYRNYRGRYGRHRNDRWKETLAYGGLRILEQWMYRPPRPRVVYVPVPPPQQLCFSNPTGYYVSIYPTNPPHSKAVAKLAPGERWPIAGWQGNYNTSARNPDGSWFEVRLPIISCN